MNCQSPLPDPNRNNLRFTITLSVLLLLVLPTNGQVIHAPDLNCTTTQVNGDVELTWNLPSNTCGPFVNYQIFGSNNFLGPYSLIATITNPSTTTYLHVGADGNNKTWWYYMISTYNCPGWTAISSDTLDNLDPQSPALDYVTVNNGGVEIFWQSVISPETFAYIIYKDAGGFNPIDTVYGPTSFYYFDNNSTPDTKPETYTIAAMDSCGNTGPFYNLPHTTVFLSNNSGTCTNELLLSWTKYVNWPDSVDAYGIYASKNGLPYTLEYTVPADSTTYAFTNFADGDTICIRIGAMHTNGVIVSYSNPVCLKVNVVQPASFLYISNATVISNSDILVEWLPDTNADLKSFDVKRSKNNSSYLTINSSQATYPLPGIMSFTDVGGTPSKTSNYYKISNRDSCDVITETGYARTIRLKGSAMPNFTNKLTWNPFEINYGAIDQYHVYKYENGLWVVLASLPDNTAEYIDNISGQQGDGGVFCYKIEATGNLSFPNGNQQSFSSFSNEVCIKQIPTVHIPTAFIPEGVNNFFKPVILFDKPGTYTMQIFNRWGEKIFETNDINAAWNGQYKGEIVAQGVYAYYISFMGINNNLVERKGTVMVIR